MKELQAKIDNFKNVLETKTNLAKHYKNEDLDDFSLGVFLRTVNEVYLINKVKTLDPIRATASGAILSAAFNFDIKSTRKKVLTELESTVIHTGEILNSYWLNKLKSVYSRNNFEYAITYLYFLCIQRGYFIPDMSGLTEKMKYELIRMAYNHNYSLINDGSEEAYVYLKYIKESWGYDPAYGGEGYSAIHLVKNDRQCKYPERFLTNERNANFNMRAEGKEIANRLIFKGPKKDALAAEYFILTFLAEDPTIELSNILCYSYFDKFGNLITNQNQKCALFKRFSR